ncbi:uncharacterized protein PHALS_13140 [Plasmopara halstedii]|uniref:Uncharacterized protein n=1 Tax=Plasmopara halstedii TaxID=4781 RepID=A0A0P1ANC3_PLAHL|nr:uncharacterized protein PHALS_13140 [Plasmopara halstedii]CEG42904.1 hypothetical protein PHALS_13140 [Plasmopara halstedii]|eukprot:XP_024579273.1 hypothetical protein PHALS_13140 [Plasmopara halstedii]
MGIDGLSENGLALSKFPDEDRPPWRKYVRLGADPTSTPGVTAGGTTGVD